MAGAEVLINPGSGPIADGLGWTNRVEHAIAEAHRWLKRMHDDGLTDVELLTDPLCTSDGDGRWTFTFRHKVTGVSVKLSTHGVSDVDAYSAQRLFAPRVYWAGSSSAEPHLDDFAAPGFVRLKTFVPEVRSDDAGERDERVPASEGRTSTSSTTDSADATTHGGAQGAQGTPKDADGTQCATVKRP